jgi:hypothetical protein
MSHPIDDVGAKGAYRVADAALQEALSLVRAYPGFLVRCKKHPTYRGMRKPMADCWACWALYATGGRT